MKQQKNWQWALQQMAEWLSHSQEFGEKPVKQQIIYERDISWPCEGYPIKVFLVRYRMKNGYEGIGITGPTTWSFIAVNNWKTLTPDDLVYCYVGWYIQFFFVDYQEVYGQANHQKAETFIAHLIHRGMIEPNFYKLCDIFQLGEDLTYYAIEVIKNGEPTYLVGTKNNYIFYKKDFPPMQLPPLFYFLGKTFNPFRSI